MTGLPLSLSSSHSLFFFLREKTTFIPKFKKKTSIHLEIHQDLLLPFQLLLHPLNYCHLCSFLFFSFFINNNTSFCSSSSPPSCSSSSTTTILLYQIRNNCETKSKTTTNSKQTSNIFFFLFLWVKTRRFGTSGAIGPLVVDSKYNSVSLPLSSSPLPVTLSLSAISLQSQLSSKSPHLRKPQYKNPADKDNWWKEWNFSMWVVEFHICIASFTLKNTKLKLQIPTITFASLSFTSEL